MKPNIILINCDDLGYGDLGCYGSELNDTPHIDALCAQGLKLTDFYMASPVCSPSRGAMLTGCYPPRIGFSSFDGQWVLFPGHDLGLHPDEKTIAQMLKEQDYGTMIIGKWHCGDQPEFLPLNFGFDQYYGLPYSNDMGRQLGREGSAPLPLIDGNEVVEEQPDQATLTSRYTERAVRFIRDHKDDPFFLYLAHMHVHLPHYSPARFGRDSRNGEYGASVMEIDWSVGVIVHELKRLGLYENTLIIFTSDNGSNLVKGGSNGPLRDKKGTTWEGGMRVPCIVSWPGQIKPGESAELVASIDFFATLAALTGGKLPDKPIDSVDVGEALFRGGRSVREVFFYYHMNGLEAVRKGKWKLHAYKGGDAVNALYDLANDVGELHNVYEEHPQIVQELNALLEEGRADLGDVRTGTQGANKRPAGRVKNPKALTRYDENHPYIIAMYDKDDVG